MPWPLSAAMRRVLPLLPIGLVLRPASHSPGDVLQRLLFSLFASLALLLFGSVPLNDSEQAARRAT